MDSFSVGREPCSAKPKSWKRGVRRLEAMACAMAADEHEHFTAKDVQVSMPLSARPSGLKAALLSRAREENLTRNFKLSNIAG